MGCCIWYSDEGTGWGCSPPRSLLAVPNVTADPSMASVPITILVYNGLLLRVKVMIHLKLIPPCTAMPYFCSLYIHLFVDSLVATPTSQTILFRLVRAMSGCIHSLCIALNVFSIAVVFKC